MSKSNRPPMTYQRREEILSKESIHYTELAELFGVEESTACSKMKEIKRVVGDRLHISGRLHIQDYLDWVAKNGTLCAARYMIPVEPWQEPVPDEMPAAEAGAPSPDKPSVFTMSSSEIRKRIRQRGWEI